MSESLKMALEDEKFAETIGIVSFIAGSTEAKKPHHSPVKLQLEFMSSSEHLA